VASLRLEKPLGPSGSGGFSLSRAASAQPLVPHPLPFGPAFDSRRFTQRTDLVDPIGLRQLPLLSHLCDPLMRDLKVGGNVRHTKVAVLTHDGTSSRAFSCKSSTLSG
jgi:hypothetical protein